MGPSKLDVRHGCLFSADVEDCLVQKLTCTDLVTVLVRIVFLFVLDSPPLLPVTPSLGLPGSPLTAGVGMLVLSIICLSSCNPSNTQPNCEADEPETLSDDKTMGSKSAFSEG